MAKIHGLAYLLIGIMIAAFSYYIDRNINKGFSFFIYIGLLMVIIGIIKLAAQWARNKKEAKPAYHHAPQHHLRHATYHQTQHHQTGHAQRQHVIYCQRCGAALRLSDNFCYNCGTRAIKPHGR